MKIRSIKVFFTSLFVLVGAMPALASAQVVISGSSGYLLFFPEVVKELTLAPDQVSKVEKMKSYLLEEIGEGKMMMRMPPGMDAVELEAMLVSPLKADQKLRLREIWVQYKGEQVVTDPVFQKELGFTAQQVKEVRTINDWITDEIMSLAGSLSDEMFAKGATPVKDKLDKKIAEKYRSVLTPEQKKKLEEMKGKPFDLKPLKKA